MHERICKIDLAALADSQGIDQLVHQVQLESFDDRLTYGLRMPDDCSIAKKGRRPKSYKDPKPFGMGLRFNRFTVR